MSCGLERGPAYDTQQPPTVALVDQVRRFDVLHKHGNPPSFRLGLTRRGCQTATGRALAARAGLRGRVPQGTRHVELSSETGPAASHTWLAHCTCNDHDHDVRRSVLVDWSS